MILNAIIRNMLQKAVLSALRTECLVQKNQKILLGFSGGPDSVCLLDMLYKAEYNVAIAYFDHQLRPESGEEVEFARRIAARYEIGLVTEKADISNLAQNEKEGIESTARKYRYLFLAEKASELGAKAIAVAHHADDQVETILMNIVRGTGLNGLAGIPYRSEHPFTGDIPVIRPMLNVWKVDILGYCEENGLKYVTDRTNFESEFTRNKIRNEIIPALITINPNVKQNILRMQTILQDENKLLSDLGQSAYEGTVVRNETNLVEINLPQFKQLSVSMQRRVIISVLSSAFAFGKDLRFQLIEDVRSFLLGELRSSIIQPDEKLKVLIEKESGFILRELDQLTGIDEMLLGKSKGKLALEIPGSVRISSSWIIQAELIDQQDWNHDLFSVEAPLIVYLDAEKVDGRLWVRRKQAGDRYAPLGMDGHSMKISDFWINKKTPQRLRKDWPLVCDQEKILWIPGFQPAHATRITNSTRAVLKLVIIRTDS
jgi:tRNA(Ile)-lysidine synthase